MDKSPRPVNLHNLPSNKAEAPPICKPKLKTQQEDLGLNTIISPFVLLSKEELDQMEEVEL